MKTCFFLLLFIFLIKFIESKKTLRTYVVKREAMISGNPLSGYSVYDSKEKTILYRLKTVSTDIDSIMLVDHLTKNIVGNLEGEWTDVFNVTLSTYDQNLNKWLDGNIKRTVVFLMEKLQIQWNGFRLVMKKRKFSRTRKFYDEQKNDFIAQFRRRARLFDSTPVKYDLKIYSNKIPDSIYFLILGMTDQREKLTADGV